MEEDKKNAAKLNALVQMVPSTDWPERKEPPEFSNSSITNNKPRLGKDHHAHSQQYHSVGGEGRKIHVFAQVYTKRTILDKISLSLLYNNVLTHNFLNLIDNLS